MEEVAAMPVPWVTSFDPDPTTVVPTPVELMLFIIKQVKSAT
jgi:hypothetical protein